MKTSRANVLIIEDDRTLGKAIEKALTREAFAATHVIKANDALELINKQKFDVLIIDCLIPGTSGVEVGMHARKKYDQLNEPLDIIFISGIFVDKKFIKDTVNQLKALDFLKKPFDLEQLINIINPRFTHNVVSTRKLFKEALTHPMELNGIYQKIESLQEINGLHIPILLSMLQQKEFSGHLNLTSKIKGEHATITFSNGSIVEIRSLKKKCSLEELLIKDKLISKEIIDRFLIEDASLNTPVPEKLIAANYLSPHLANLMAKRINKLQLSELIVDENIIIKLSSEQVENKDSSLNKEEFVFLLQDLTCSKIAVPWLKAFLRSWNNFIVVKGPNSDAIDSYLNLPLIRHLGDNPEHQIYERSVREILTNNSADEFLRILYFLAALRIIAFVEQISFIEDNEQKYKRLNSILEEISTKDDSEIIKMWGVSKQTSEWEISEAYNDFLTLINNEKQDSPEVVSLSQKLQELCATVYKRLINAESKINTYSAKPEKLQNDEAVEKLMENILSDLKRSQSEKALENLKKIIKLNPPQRKNIITYMIWAKITNFKIKTPSMAEINQIELELLHVPLEERNEAPYLYIKAMLNMYTGHLLKSKSLLKKCLSIDPLFMDAKSELEKFVLKEETTYIEQTLSILAPK